MKYDIILCGVGGQGVLSLAAAIALGAMKEGLNVRQSEVHGMAQRGGAVLANLRMSDEEIAGDLIGKGRADMLLSMEPLESLRYVDYLSQGGVLLTASNPFENIPNYPALEEVLKNIRALPKHRVIDAKALAKEAEAPQAVNMVMVGAASKELPLKQRTLEEAMEELFSKKGEGVVEKNKKAFSLGRNST